MPTQPPPLSLSISSPTPHSVLTTPASPALTSRCSAANPRAKYYTSNDPAQACAIGTMGFEGIDPVKLTAHLWDRARVIVTPIKHVEFNGIRVTPNVYTTLEEVDTLATELERVLDRGIPATA